MATRRSKSGTLRRKDYAVKSPRRDAEKSSRKDDLSALTQAIEVQRDNLAKADSVLGCLVIAMEYGEDSVSAPYYPDVAQIARDLVQQSLRGLDAVNLQQPLRDKVKDAIHVGLVSVSIQAFVPPLLTSPPNLLPWRSARGLPLHRRNYGSARKQLLQRRLHSTF